MHRATHEASRVWFAVGILSSAFFPCSLAIASHEFARRPDPPNAEVPARTPWDRLCDATLTDADRLHAAAEVLALSPLPLDKIGTELRFPFAGKSGSIYLARAIEHSSEPPSTLFELVRARFDIASRDELPTLLAAIGSFGSRDAARVALRYLQEEGPMSTAAQAALARATGRDDLASDRRAWTTWLDEVRGMSDAEWSAELARRRGSQLQRLAEHERAVVSRLLESLRKTHIDTPEADRPALLTSYIKDTIPEIRELGFTLINRELGAGATLGPEVGSAALELLFHPDVRTRAAAALLVNQLSPPGAEDRVLAALERETEPLAAGALLDAASRWASPRLTTLVLTWLTTTEDPSWKAATNALWALTRAGALLPSQQSEALLLLRNASDEELSSSACRVLGTLGNDADRARLARLLDGDSPTRRLAAAAALAPYAEHCDAIVTAAGLDEELFSTAARATRLHRPTRAGYEALRAVAPSNLDVRREGLLFAAGGLSAIDLYALASDSIQRDERTDLLEELTSESRMMSERMVPENLDAMLHGTIDLAHLRLEADRGESALVLLDQFVTFANDPVKQEFSNLQVAALLLMDRLELAEVLDTPCTAWLLGLRLCVNKPHAATIATAIETRFGESLAPAQRDELNELKLQIAQGSSIESTRAGSAVLPK